MKGGEKASFRQGEGTLKENIYRVHRKPITAVPRLLLRLQLSKKKKNGTKMDVGVLRGGIITRRGEKKGWFATEATRLSNANLDSASSEG